MLLNYFINFEQITYLNGSKPVAAPCEKRGIWRNYIHVQYLNCATFEPFSYLRLHTTNIEMYIYLDEILNSATCPDCFHGEIKSQLSGALITIHGANMLPNINDKSINLKPGSLTEIRLSIVENIQQRPPYGQCSMNHPEQLKMYDMYYNYSEYACRESNMQSYINKNCNCYSMEFPYNEDSSFESCSNLKYFINKLNCLTKNLWLEVKSKNFSNSHFICIEKLQKFIKRMMCKQSLIENYVNDRILGCAMPCSFYSYETDQSTSTWPAKNWQLTWLNSFYNKKLGIFQGPEFYPYHKAQAWLDQGNETMAAQILEQTSVLEQKLLAVLINRPNFNVKKVEEKEVLSITSLLSQTGGLLSIWIGLSMVSFGELIEMCIRCIVRARKYNQKLILNRSNSFSHSCNCNKNHLNLINQSFDSTNLNNFKKFKKEMCNSYHDMQKTHHTYIVKHNKNNNNNNVDELIDL